jgi:hypothetical protein
VIQFHSNGIFKELFIKNFPPPVGMEYEISSENSISWKEKFTRKYLSSTYSLPRGLLSCTACKLLFWGEATSGAREVCPVLSDINYGASRKGKLNQHNFHEGFAVNPERALLLLVQKYSLG